MPALPFSARSRVVSALRRFARDRRGAATVEYVLWLPFFVLIIGLTADAALTFHTHSRMWDAARDTARRAATGQLDAQSAESYAISRLPGGGGFTVQVDDSGAQDVVVTITTQGGDLGLTGVLDVIGDGTLRSTYRMRKEVWNG